MEDIEAVPKTKGKDKAKVSEKNGGRPDYQPFNVGKFSTVRKEKAEDLALDSDDSALSDSTEEVKPKKTTRATKAKSKGRGKAKKADSDESAFELGDEVEDDSAMDSEAEEKQLKSAIKESLGERGRAAGSSRSSSTSARGKTRGKGRAQPVGGRNNSAALRVAAAKAAESGSHMLTV